MTLLASQLAKVLWHHCIMWVSEHLNEATVSYNVELGQLHFRKTH